MRTRFSTFFLLSLGFYAAPLFYGPFGLASADTKTVLQADAEPEFQAGAEEARAPSVEGRARLEAGRSSIQLSNPALPFAIAALELSAESSALPRRVQIKPRGGDEVTLDIPRAAERFEHRFEPALEADSLTLELERGAEVQVDIRLITDASAGRLIDALLAGGTSRLRARALLPTLGSGAIPAMEARFDELEPRAQRDLIAIYGQLARDRRAAERLLNLSASARPEDAEHARLAAEALPPALLGEAIRRGSLPALRLVTRGEPGRLLRPLLDSLEREKKAESGESSREEMALREARGALSAIARRFGEEAAAEIGEALNERSALLRARSLPAWAALPVLDAMVADEIGALARVQGCAKTTEKVSEEDVAQTVHQGCDEASDEASAFEIRYRVLEALAALSGSLVDEALLQIARRELRAKEWMIRALAYEALSAHRPDDPALLGAFDDEYPRVRLLAASRFAGLPDEEALPKLRKAAEDPFPMVREGAIRAASLKGEALGTTRDSAGNVRLAVYEHMAADPAQRRGLMRALQREERPKVLGAFLTSALDRCDARFTELAERLVVTADTRDDEASRAGKTALFYLLSFEGEARDRWLREIERRGAGEARGEVPIRCPR